MAIKYSRVRIILRRIERGGFQQFAKVFSLTAVLLVLSYMFYEYQYKIDRSETNDTSYFIFLEKRIVSKNGRDTFEIYKLEHNHEVTLHLFKK